MEAAHNFPEKEKIFKPRRRRLVDLLLLLNSLGLIFVAFKSVSPAAVAIFCISMTCFTILIWVFVLTPLMTIRIGNNTVTGPNEKFRRESIPFRKIHFTNTIVSREGAKRIFFKDIHSIDGRIIRIHRQFLGESQVNTIIVTIERYPFREGT